MAVQTSGRRPGVTFPTDIGVPTARSDNDLDIRKKKKTTLSDIRANRPVIVETSAVRSKLSFQLHQTSVSIFLFATPLNSS
jgi:hypothetical protein